jgi:hypothetical protein
MSTESGITLQINLAPTDLPHAKHILPHQLRQWAGQVDEVLLVVDMHRSRGRFAEGWKERLPGLQMLIEYCCARYGHAHAREVDYSTDVAASISDLFFGGQLVPTKDCKGGPFYSYFFGLYAAKHPYVFHMDSDMMYGGGSSCWLAEAVQLLRERTNVLICSPLPGPPTANGDLRSQFLERESYTSLAFRAQCLSTRHFFIDKNRFSSTIKQLPLIQPSRLRTWQALAEGNPPYELPEVIFSRAMSDHNLIRVEFLGTDPGMWSIHPLYRSELFYDRLPDIIQKIETGDIPEAQRGCHDVNASLVDWTSTKQPAWKRIAKHARLVLQRFRLLDL